ncbi:hypothetical protein H0H92_011537 [Tricholoma furcatifolium]|nr:hypothetical protein H0H92_011537 [Tricholoma furcatifolium]
MSSPLSSPSELNHSADKALTEAKGRLAAAHIALKSAEETHMKILAIPLKKRGGGAARKQKALADYESALQEYQVAHAEFASLSQKILEGHQIARSNDGPDHAGDAENTSAIDDGVENTAEADSEDADGMNFGVGIAGSQAMDVDSGVEDAMQVDGGNTKVNESGDLEDADGDESDEEDEEPLEGIEDAAGESDREVEGIEDAAGEGESDREVEGIEDTDGEHDDAERKLEGEQVQPYTEEPVDNIEERDAKKVNPNVPTLSMDSLFTMDELPEMRPVKKSRTSKGKAAVVSSGEYFFAQATNTVDRRLVVIERVPTIETTRAKDGKVIAKESKPAGNKGKEKSSASTSRDKNDSEAASKDPVFYKQKKVAKIKITSSTENGEGKYESMDPEIQEKFQRAAKVAFDEFLRRPNATVIDINLRYFIRANQAFMPSAATRSRKLALEILTNNRTNVMCIYHHTYDKDGVGQDGTGTYKLNGMPFPRLTNSIKADGVEPEPGYMHCGCSEENALFDFHFWKTWQLSGTLEDGTFIQESLRDQLLKPRLRAFVVQQFKQWTGLSIDDMYQNNMSKKEHKIKMYTKQINYLMKGLNKLAKEDGERYYWAVEEVSQN